MTRAQKWIVTSFLALATLLAAVFFAANAEVVAQADNGLEIDYVGANHVKPNAEENDTDMGAFPIGYLGEHYEAQLHAIGGSGSYLWELVEQSTLPEGLTLDPDTGMVSGMPESAEPGASICIKVTDKNDGQRFDIAILTLTIMESREESPTHGNNAYDDPLEIYYPIGEYSLGARVQFESSIGNDQVEWSIKENRSSETTISDGGVLTIGSDEMNTYVIVYAISKMDNNNSNFVRFDFMNPYAYSLTIIDGVATNGPYPITGAVEGDIVRIEANPIEGKRFRNWSVESGSMVFEFADDVGPVADFAMPAGPLVIMANYDIVIDRVSVTFDAPMKGNRIDDTLAMGDVGYFASFYAVQVGVVFFDPADVIYESGQEYTFYLRFFAQDGHVLALPDELTVIINGRQCGLDSYSSADDTWAITLSAPEEIVEPEYSHTTVNGVEVYTDSLEAGIPKDLSGLFAAAKAANGIVKLTMDSLILDFDTAAVDALGGKTFSLSAFLLRMDQLGMDGAQLIITTALIAEDAALGDGQVTLSVPFVDTPKGKVAKIYDIGDAGEMSEKSASFAGGQATFETNRFASFALVFESEPVVVQSEEGLSGGAIAGITVGAVSGGLTLVGLIMVILHQKGIVTIKFIAKLIAKITSFFRKRKKKKE